ncbi:MAG: sulfatase-like hydrolase/transferase, partial [Candidatus Latescibacteria bacterium]|nr:sulfatase-like hydrolase/transferase [Candidatus Latescibacterota bacterium]
YYGLTTGIDSEFGRITQALKDSGQVDNTIVIFASDHGEMLGSQGLQAKRWPYSEASQIPFVIRWPGKIEAGSSLSMPFGTPDIFPTLCGLAGLDVPEGLDG